MTLGCIVLDWLHIVDLGVGADIIGNYFYDLLTVPGVIAGRSQEDRLTTLWSTLKEWYKQARPASQLDHLTKEMVRADGKKPKLRAKGAECRYLVPFAAGLARTHASFNLHFRTVAGVLKRLLDLQMMVSGASEWNYSEACSCCVELMVLYSALAAEAVHVGREKCWQLKPKFHLLQEMIEYQSAVTGNPSEFWCYRDESWCGWWAKASHRRGGPNFAATTARRLLDRYRAFEDLE